MSTTTTTTTLCSTSLPSPAAPFTDAPRFRLHPPDHLASLIESCKSTSHLLQIHAAVLRHGYHAHPILTFKLHKSYSSLGLLHSSCSLFSLTPHPNVYLYSSIIHSHAISGLHSKALQFYLHMLLHDVSPNQFTLSSLFKNCPLRRGIELHSQAVRFGVYSDLYVRTAILDLYARCGDIVSARKVFDGIPGRSLVSWTAMLSCYAKNGYLESAREVFDEMPERDVVCWNVMIDGYSQFGNSKECLVLFREMLRARLRPDEITLLPVLSACGQLGALELGRWVHSYAVTKGIPVVVQLGTALVDMYSKSGSLEEARRVFDAIPCKDVVAWNSMIGGYAMHGLSREALRLFDEMCEKGFQPTDVTFIGVLNACAHAGLITEGKSLFNLIKTPKVEHYGCMVNLLARAGHLQEAYDLVRDNNINPDPVVWGTLLGACAIHGNLSLGKEIAEFLIKENLANSGTYILLSNIYASTQNWDGVAKVRNLMKANGMEKEPGCSSIEVRNKVYEFVAGDHTHPESKEIYTMLGEIDGWLKAKGYTPQTNVVLHDLEETGKVQSLRVHSEKLAIAFGLISTEPGSTVHIVKNLRVCADCHEVSKLISKITGRKIIIRDRNRFHHFVDGSCSCGDYW